MPAPMLELDPDRLRAELRPAVYEMVNAWLSAHRLIGSALQVAPAEMLVYLTVAVASGQRLIRSGSMPDDLRGGAPLPNHLRGGISRRGIAEATGLPRETVRRHVATLIGSGRVVEMTRGRVAVPADFLEQIDSRAAIAELATIVARMAETLMRLGVIRNAR